MLVNQCQGSVTNNSVMDGRFVAERETDSVQRLTESESTTTGDTMSAWEEIHCFTAPISRVNEID